MTLIQIKIGSVDMDLVPLTFLIFDVATFKSLLSAIAKIIHLTHLCDHSTPLSMQNIMCNFHSFKTILDR